MAADLPPNSKEILLTSSAANFETSIPPFVDPVNVTISISLCFANKLPTSDPLPETRLKTPLGKLARSIASANRKATSGVF